MSFTKKPISLLRVLVPQQLLSLLLLAEPGLFLLQSLSFSDGFLFYSTLLHSYSMLLPSSNQPSGAVAFAIQRIGPATIAAITSGRRSANCLGTSSPTISEA